jgi:hypothetical protein
MSSMVICPARVVGCAHAVFQRGLGPLKWLMWIRVKGFSETLISETCYDRHPFPTRSSSDVLRSGQCLMACLVPRQILTQRALTRVALVMALSPPRVIFRCAAERRYASFACIHIMKRMFVGLHQHCQHHIHGACRGDRWFVGV